MMNLLKALCFSLCVLCLSACWTMGKLTRDYCQNMNAYERGRLSALHGQAGKKFDQDIKKCAQYGVALSREQYQQGREKGLKLFCSYDKGHEWGLKGNKYLNICPKGLELAFLKGYKQGDKKCAYNAGEADGANGKTASAFSDIKCAQVNKKLSQREYTRGRKKGLKLFCSYDKGHEWGLKGNKYPNICPKGLELAFLKGYTLGFQEYHRLEMGRLEAAWASAEAAASSAMWEASSAEDEARRARDEASSAMWKAISAEDEARRARDEADGFSPRFGPCVGPFCP